MNIGFVSTSDMSAAPCPPISISLRSGMLASRSSEGRGGSDIRFAWLELTPHCNLRCSHCYADSGPERPVSSAGRSTDWFDVLRRLSRRGCRVIQFIGGEPMLHPGFFGFLDYAAALGFERIEVFTNGTALTRRNVEHLARRNVSLAVSIFSSLEAVHDRLAGTRGSWSRTVEGLRNSIGKLPVHGAIIDADPACDPAATAQYLATMGVEDIGIHRVRAVGRGAALPNAASNSCNACGLGCIAVGYDGQVRPCVFRRDEVLARVEDYLRDI